MTRKEFQEFHRDSIEKMHSIMLVKNADYTGASNDDPFFNFKQIELLGVTTAEAGIMTRMMDKIARISTFLKKGQLQVEDEGVYDTLLDLANYTIILSGYLKDKSPKKIVTKENITTSSLSQPNQMKECSHQLLMQVDHPTNVGHCVHSHFTNHK